MALGIRLHRRIDAFTDAHPCWRRSRQRFPAPLRRFAGIAVDVSYDHFLARDWRARHPLALSDFTRAAYRAIAAYEAWFPPRLERLFARIAGDDWLAAYRHFDSVETALARMARRSPRLAPLADTGAAARAVYAGLDADFQAFFPDLCAAAGEARAALVAERARR